MLHYWQNNVAENFLPAISDKKRLEIEMRKIANEPLKVKKQAIIRIKSAQRHLDNSQQQRHPAHLDKAKANQSDEAHFIMMSDAEIHQDDARVHLDNI